MATTLITTLGQKAIAEAIANNTTIKIAKIAVGDGGGAVYTPTVLQTALKNIKWSGSLNSVGVNPENANQVIFEGLIAPGTGGFFIREVGLYDSNNILIAVSDFPESFKAAADQYELFIRMVLEVSNASAIVNVNKDLIYATKDVVNSLFAIQNKNIELKFTEQNNSLDSFITSSEEEKNLSIIKSNKDSEGIFTTLTYKLPNGTIYATSVLSGGTSPKYTTRTVKFYQNDGTTVKKTKVYTLAYDSDGDLVSEV